MLPILISGLFDQWGQNLSLSANLHLFLWDGDLIAREEPHDRAQDKIEEKGIEQWRYTDSYPNTQSPAISVVEKKPRPQSQPLPKISIEKVRERIKQQPTSHKYPDPSPFRPDPVRPNATQQFEAWQQRNKTLSLHRDIPNPYLEGFRFPDIQEIKVPDSAIAQGQQWTINELVGEWVIGDWLTEKFGAVTYNLLQAYPEASEGIENFREYRLYNLKQQALNQEQRALEEIEKYRYYGSLPVADGEGILELPTLTNIATAYVLIENLLSAIGIYRGNVIGIEGVLDDQN